MYMMYLDLDELSGLIDRGVLYGSRFAPLSFRPEDHRIAAQRPMAEAVRDLVAERTGERPAGPIRLLTGLRCFGYYFSPLNLYYCFDASGERVETVVAEVSNTPWLETHYYVLSDENRVDGPGGLRFSHPKSFHVSPFMGMDVQYDWRLSRPEARLAVHLANRQGDRRVFQAGLALSRRELGRGQIAKLLLRYPWMTGQIALGIYFQAYRLWRKKCPFHAHPKHAQQPAGSR